MGEVHEVAEVLVRRLPRQAGEDADVVQEEQEVLLEPAAEHPLVEITSSDALHRRMGQLLVEEGPAHVLEVAGKAHGESM